MTIDFNDVATNLVVAALLGIAAATPSEWRWIRRRFKNLRSLVGDYLYEPTWNWVQTLGRGPFHRMMAGGARGLLRLLDTDERLNVVIKGFSTPDQLKRIHVSPRPGINQSLANAPADFDRSTGTF